MFLTENFRNLTKTERPRLQLKERLPKPEQMIKPKKVEFNDNVTSYSFDNYISSDEEANLLSQDIENVCFIEVYYIGYYITNVILGLL